MSDRRETRRGVCETCGRSRKLVLCDRYYWRCEIECQHLTSEERKMKAGERRQRTRERTAKKKKAYPVIGGPLDGEHALTADFDRQYGRPGTDEWYTEQGMYAHLADEYEEYNASGRSSGPSMIFVHTSLLRPVVPGRAR